MNNGSAMRKIVLVLIAVMFCALAAAFVLYIADGGRDSFISGLEGNGSNNYSGGSSSALNDKVDEEKEETLSGIENIIISNVSDNIKLIPADSEDTAKAHYYGEYSSSNKNYKPTLTVNKSGNTLEIKIEYPKMLNINFNSNLKLDVYVPASYAGNMKIGTVSADTEIDTLKLKSFRHNAVSGKLKLGSLEADRTEIHTTSGDCSINGSLGDFSFTSVSGRLSSDNFNAKKSEIRMTSGDVDLAGNPGESTFHSISGKIRIDSPEKLSAGIEAGTTSGNVEIKLPADSEFNIDFRATSGEVKCDFPITVNGSPKEHSLKGTVGGGGSQIKVNSVSGGLDIEKK